MCGGGGGVAGSIHLDVTRSIHALQRRVEHNSAGGTFSLIDACATYAGWHHAHFIPITLLSLSLSSAHKGKDRHKNKRHVRALWGSRTKRREEREREKKKERDR